MTLRPFFSFFGGKWRIAPRYPAPAHDILVEPFAGSAGYATRYPDRKVVLVERDPIIASLWRWLIRVPAEEIRALPLIEPDQRVDELGVCPDAESLIGFWCNKGCTTPRKQITTTWGTKYPDQFWHAGIRERVASQVDAIRHWTVIEGDYFSFGAGGLPATWFIDPPYCGASRVRAVRGGGKVQRVLVGDRYRFGASAIDFVRLASWCQSRRGQVIVCENVGATWLPFEHFATSRALPGRSARKTILPGVSEEAVWLGGRP